MKETISRILTVATIGLTGRFALTLLSLGLTSTLSFAQTAPSFVSRASIDVKPEMVDEWEDLMKAEVLPAFKKAGIPSVLTYRTAQFGAAFRYLIFTPITNFAAYDGDGPYVKALGREGASRLLGKLRKCVNSVSRSASLFRTDLGYASDGFSPEGVFLFIELDVVPGKLSELESYLQDSFVPLVKSGGAPAFVIHETYLGEASEMTLALPIGNYATLDVIFAGLPETDPMDSLTDHIQLSLLAFASELSYLP